MLDAQAALTIAADTTSADLAYSCQTPVRIAGAIHGCAGQLDRCASAVLLAQQHCFT